MGGKNDAINNRFSPDFQAACPNTLGARSDNLQKSTNRLTTLRRGKLMLFNRRKYHAIGNRKILQ